MNERNRGLFIVFEGLDGCGKTTQLRRLKQRLNANEIRCAETREPGDGILGLLARGAVKGKVALETETLALLFAADRYEHTVTEIIPLLEKGITVLCDRYYYSNIAYQGLKLGHDWITIINRDSMKKIKPDIVLFFDASPEECAKRRAFDRIETEIFDDILLQKDIRESFFKTFELLGENPVIIEASYNEDDISDTVWNHVGKELFC